MLTSTIRGGTVTVAIGTLQTAATFSSASSTLTFGPKANGTSLTYTPSAVFVGTINVSAKLITPISIFALNLKDSGGVSSWEMLQPLSSLNNTFSGGGGTYNTTGNQNSFMGTNAGQANTTGYSNSFMGTNAGQANTTGNSNSFMGMTAGQANTTGYSNSFMGVSAGQANTTGNSNSFMGVSAGQANTTANSNSFIGVNAGQANTTGNSNSFMGTNAGQANTTGYNNSFMGVTAGRYIADGATANATGNNSVYLGYLSKAKADGESNETAIGANAVGNGSNTVTLGGAGTLAVYSPGIYITTGTAPSISGCSSATLVGNNMAGIITAGGVSCNAVLTFNVSATNGWSCMVNNQTHPGATNLVGQASSTVNSATFVGTTVTSDKLNYYCTAY